MNARMQLMLVKMNDPRTIRVILVGLAIGLAAAAQAMPFGVQAVLAGPATGGGGCSGG
ncbi:MAG: hypothetical protein JXC32_18885 [Anaerolineae bacterium]|nr:hypothetical protein [Anaerolineae bacterium]